MSRDWKPGDVAMDSDGGIALVVPHHFSGCPKYHADAGVLHIHYADGDWNSLIYAADRMRPLVVLDPEDRDAARRLLGDFCRAVDASDVPAHPQGWSTDAMQAALREFANPTPPKPEEPTGLGAVVEDANGLRWTRAGSSHVDGNWLRPGSSAYFHYADVLAVRVLSEGVQA